MTGRSDAAASPDDTSGLAARAAAGDREAFAALYTERVERTFRYLRFRVGAVGVAADLTQDVWLRAFAAIHTLRDPDRFDAWLLAIARNRLRHHWARHRDEPLEAAEAASGHGRPPGGTVSSRLDLDGTLEDERLVHAVASLSAARREVIALRFGAGYGLKETAALLGKREAAVKQLQHRALSDLRARLHHEDPSA